MKKELKNQNKHLVFDIVDVLSHIDPTPTNKYLPLLVREAKNILATPAMMKTEKSSEKATTEDGYDKEDHYVRTISVSSDYDYDTLFNTPYFFLRFFNSLNNELVENSGIDMPIIELLKTFDDYCKRNLIEEKDVQKYKGLVDINKAIGEAKFKELINDNVFLKQILYEDKTWLIIRPLTHDASVKYGFGAKWCTSMRHNSEYFYRYTREGVLIYAINKVSRQKIGIFMNEARKGSWLKFYDENDQEIDSALTNLPARILNMITDVSNTGLTNLQYLRENYPELAVLVDRNKEAYITEAEEAPPIAPEPNPMVQRVQLYEDPVLFEVNGPVGQPGQPGVVNNENFEIPNENAPVFDIEALVNNLTTEFKQHKLSNFFNNLFGKNKLVTVGLPKSTFMDINVDLTQRLNEGFKGYYFIVYPTNDNEPKFTRI